MAEKKDIDQIFATFLSGKATDYEKEQLKKWAAESELNAYQFDELQKIWKERLPDPKLIDSRKLENSIWAAIHEDKDSSGRGRKFHMTGALIWRAAAVLLLLMIPIYLVLRYSDLEPSLEAKVNTYLVQKSNPIGQKSKIQLPDGSIVWLNAESKLSYSEDFSDSVRWVRLQGEAFFNVTKDTLHPFVVQTENLNIRVLGTQFNVSAFKDLSQEEVALLEGEVEVSITEQDPVSAHIVFLKPGEGLSYDKKTNVMRNLAIGSLDPAQNKYAGWKEGVLIFDGEDFEQFLALIRRWYGVHITVKGIPPANWRIRGSFKDEYLTNIMEAISFNKEFSYTIDRKDLTIIFK